MVQPQGEERWYKIESEGQRGEWGGDGHFGFCYKWDGKQLERRNVIWLTY